MEENSLSWDGGEVGIKFKTTMEAGNANDKREEYHLYDLIKDLYYSFPINQPGNETTIRQLEISIKEYSLNSKVLVVRVKDDFGIYEDHIIDLEAMSIIIKGSEDYKYNLKLEDLFYE